MNDAFSDFPFTACLSGQRTICKDKTDLAIGGELLLTIMSSLAQEESRSISENCTWGQRKRFADGKVTVPFNRFLGYDMGPDRNLVVNPEQAKLVKRIYGMFLLGKSPFQIASTLTEEGIPSGSLERQQHPQHPHE